MGKKDSLVKLRHEIYLLKESGDQDLIELQKLADHVEINEVQ